MASSPQRGRLPTRRCPRRSHISAISLTKPMLTIRNVFSSSFTISAAWGELTGTIVSTAAPYRGAAQLGGFRAEAAYHFRDVMRVEDRIARVDPFGRKRQKEIDACLQSARFEHRFDELFGCSRIRRRLEDDEHARDAGAGRRARPPTRCTTCRGPSSCEAASARRC